MEHQQAVHATEGMSHTVLVLPNWVRVLAKRFVLFASGCLIAYFVFGRISTYPTIIGWDEGIYLQFAHNLGYHGVYATSSGGTFARLIPTGGTGPTLIAPVALALRLSGDNLTAARLVMSGYLLIAIVGVYVLVRQISNQRAALVAIPLFLAAGYPPYNTLWMGRQVLAEVPAFAFIFLGLWALHKSWRGKTGWLIAGSLLIASAVITKNQLIWTLGPSFALLGIVDRIYYRQLHWKYSIAPLVAIIFGYGSWFLASLWIVGSAERARYLADQKELTAVTFFHIGIPRWLENAHYLGARIDLTLLIICAFGYGLYRSRARSLQGLQRAVLPVFGCVFLMSFLLISLPWARFLYPALVFAALCAASLAVDFARFISSRWRMPDIGGIVVIVIVVIILAGPALGRTALRIADTDNKNAAEFASLVDRLVPSNAGVLNWEFEVEFYAQHGFVHPPENLYAAFVDKTYNHPSKSLPDQRYSTDGIDYIVVGPFAHQTEIFNTELSRNSYQLVTRVGVYELYRRGT